MLVVKFTVVRKQNLCTSVPPLLLSAATSVPAMAAARDGGIDRAADRSNVSRQVQRQQTSRNTADKSRCCRAALPFSAASRISVYCGGCCVHGRLWRPCTAYL
jgi:hypothetical protein